MYTTTKSIINIPNPFDCSRPVKSLKEFAGRLNEIDNIKEIFNDVEAGLGLNVAIHGERACGKSSLLNIIKEIANDKGALTYKIDLDENIITSGLDMMVTIFDGLIDDGITKGFWGDEGEESEYYQTWKANIDFYEIGDRSKHFLQIGPIYANAKAKDLDYVLRPNIIENDFKKLLSKSEKNKIPFIAIFIDEADLFSKNKGLLELIRNIIQNLTKVIFVLSGTHQMFSLIDDVFSPIQRQFRKIKLGNFQHFNETIECFFKPLESQGVKRHEIKKFISYDTIRELHKNTYGNPYHIKLLSRFMLKNFQDEGDDTKNIVINDVVLNNVYENIWSSSESSKRVIHKILPTLSKDQLKSLGFLLGVNGLDLKSAGIIRGTFKTFSTGYLRDSVAQIIDEYKKIDSCGLITISNVDEESVNDVYDDVKGWQNYEIQFHGDHLDVLFTEQFLRKMKIGVYIKEASNSFEEELSISFKVNIWFDYRNTITKYFGKQPFPAIISDGGKVNTKEKEEIFSFSLNDIFSDLLKELDSNNYKEAYTKAKEVGLIDLLGFIVGYYACAVYQISGEIKNKPFFIRLFQPINEGEKFPIQEDDENIQYWEPKELLHTGEYEEVKDRDYESYGITITKQQSLILHRQFINSLAGLDLSEKSSIMHDNVISGEYESALEAGGFIYSLTRKYTDLNNLGFIYLLLDDYKSANDSFEKTLKEMQGYQIAQYNKGYIDWISGNQKDVIKAERSFRKLIKLSKNLSKEQNMTLCLKVPMCDNNSISKFDPDWDLFFDIDLLTAAYLGLSTLLLSQQQLIAGESFYKKAKAVSPDHFSVKRFDAWLSYYKGEIETAKAKIQKLINLDEDKSDLINKQLNTDKSFFTSNV